MKTIWREFKFFPSNINAKFKFNFRSYENFLIFTIFSAHITVNDELPNRIASGTVRVKPGIKSFTETSIHFEDGTFVENVDEVILATGFSFHFNLIENGNLVKVDENKTDAFKYMFPMATADKNTLAVIGLVQVIGSIMPISEMQARVYLESFAAGRELPSKEEVRGRVFHFSRACRNLQIGFVYYLPLKFLLIKMT